MSMENIAEENKINGTMAEARFKEWLEKHHIPYMYIQQDLDTFSSVFKEHPFGKRPDFMVLIPHFGLIFVDVKYKKLNKEYKTFTLDSDESKKYSRLQRKFNLQIWYVLSNEDYDYKTWFWIPVSKILEEGIQRHMSNKSKQDFFAVPPTEFVQISIDSSLDRLFSNLFEKK